ncbi:MAG: trypsin-like peptidase domain-containing protein [Rubrobacteraceae bacterium]|nr:trypsin-like peptidase domain-containing protein [Rubrobacteraceae bacterium]MDQ3435925.1 trypsin-like peptidase domain-containing protein [Actinomycetota bacterium]
MTIKEVAPSPESSGATPVSNEGPSVREVYTRDGRGVVSVDVAVTSEAGPGGGSGFVVDEAGHIVTNQHVVEEAEEISVRFADGVRREAEVVGQDPSTDVALLKVEAPKAALEPLTLGDSNSVGVGEPVIAIGNPLNVGISVTTGIVSGLGRPITAPNNYTINDAVQTDAAINPGNSGGPLLDSRGTVIGVNAQIASESGGFEGVGFAVPINTVKDVIKQLITDGKVVHGYIGVSMYQLGIDELSAYAGLSEKALRERYGLPGNGAIVSEVTPDGPAQKAGIRGGDEKDIEGIPIPMGDVITGIEGDPVSSSEDVIEVVNAVRPGERLLMTVVTPGEKGRRVNVTVGTRPEGV